jgi:hypothetical protein
LLAVAAMILRQSHDLLEGIGPATRYAIWVNYMRRAAFIVDAARRVQRSVNKTCAAGELLLAASEAALAEERTRCSR